MAEIDQGQPNLDARAARTKTFLVDDWNIFPELQWWEVDELVPSRYVDREIMDVGPPFRVHAAVGSSLVARHLRGRCCFEVVKRMT